MIRVAAWPVPGEGSLPGLQMAAFSPRPHMAGKGGDRVRMAGGTRPRGGSCARGPSRLLRCVPVCLLLSWTVRLSGGQAGAPFPWGPLFPAQSGCSVCASE